MKPKVILNIAISLDGYVASPDGGVDWLEGFDNLSDYGFDEFIAGIGAIIMGKRSYDLGMRKGWFKGSPYGSSPIYVVCHQKPEVSATDDGNFKFIDEGIKAAYVAAKSAAGDKHIYLFGGPTIIQQSLAENLIDELQLSIAPVILGEGIPLFANLSGRKINLECIDTKTYPGGLASIKYRVKHEILDRNNKT